MLSEIQERIQDIIEGAAELETNPKVPDGLPAALDDTDMPQCLILPSNIGWKLSGGDRYTTIIQYDLRLYISPIGVRYSKTNLFELLHYFDQFVEVFLSRPQLQWNGAALRGVAGNLTFQNVSNLSRPIAYPLSTSDTSFFWGSVYQLGIPFRTSYALKPTGE